MAAQKPREKSLESTSFLGGNATIWLVTCLGIALSLLGFTALQRQLDSHRAVELEWVVHNRYRALEGGILRCLEAVRSIADLAPLESDHEGQGFELLTGSILRRIHGTRSLVWAPHVSFEAREAWESRASGSQGVEILEAGVGDTFGKAADRDYYTPILFHTSSPSIAMPRGLDLESLPILRAALDRARDSRAMTISSRLPMATPTGESYAFAVVQPVVNAAVDGPEGKIKGFAVGVFLLSEVAQVSIDVLEPRGVDCLIRDESASDGEGFLTFYGSRLAGTPATWEEVSLGEQSTRSPREDFVVADRNWSVTCAPNLQFRSAEAFVKGPWLALGGGFFFTLLLTSYLVRSRQSLLQRLDMEWALRDREELFWQMTETVSEVFWAATPQRERFLYISPAFENVWGISCGDLYRSPELFVSAIEPEDRGIVESAILRLQRERGPVEAVFRLKRSDGVDRWIRDRAFPILESDGSISRLVGVAEDITEERMAREALRQSENRLRDLFNQSPDLIFTVDPSGKVLFHNRSTPELPTELALGIDSKTLLPTAVRAQYQTILNEVFATGEVTHFEFERSDGSQWEIRLVPLKSRQSIVNTMVIATDVSENRRLRNEAEHNARLASVGVLAAGVAHEINNPNNAIRFNASVLSRAWQEAQPILADYHEEHGDFALAGLPFVEATQDLTQLLDQIQKNSGRIERIVKSLKYLSRRDTTGLDSEVDLRLTVEGAAAILGSEIEKRTDHFRIQLGDSLKKVRGSSEQLEQVFVNVIQNALESLADRSKSVSVESLEVSDKPWVSIRVLDQGEGISEKHLESLTEPFFSTRQATGGMGLGLSIARSIIDQHGGRIEFESHPGRGTTVTISLPASKEARR